MPDKHPILYSYNKKHGNEKKVIMVFRYLFKRNIRSGNSFFRFLTFHNCHHLTMMLIVLQLSLVDIFYQKDLLSQFLEFIFVAIIIR